MQSCSNAEEQADGGQHPLSRLLFGFQVEGPDVGGAADTRLVDGALIDVLGFLPVHGDGLDEEDGHCRSQLLETRITDHARLGVPASAWDKQHRTHPHTCICLLGLHGGGGGGWQTVWCVLPCLRSPPPHPSV